MSTCIESEKAKAVKGEAWALSLKIMCPKSGEPPTPAAIKIQKTFTSLFEYMYFSRQYFRSEACLKLLVVHNFCPLPCFTLDAIGTVCHQFFSVLLTYEGVSKSFEPQAFSPFR